jgi:two-component system chemotaxis response regulator CheB
MSQTIRVVVIDDSAVMRRAITMLIERDPAIRVVGVARDGREAIGLVERLRPDIVTMDVRMPVMDGLEATEHLMAYCPTPIIVLTASLASHEVDITFRMLNAGALEVIEKPRIDTPLALERAAHDLIRRIKLLSRTRVVTHLRGRRRSGESGTTARRPPAALPEHASRAVAGQGETPSAARRLDSAKVNGRPSAPATASTAGRPDFPAVVIGASTGGPRAVYQILSELPRSFPGAILVVQHIAAGFSSGMAEWLASASVLPVRLAAEGDAIKPGVVLVAPDQHDLLITPEAIVHLNNNPLLIQRPAIDITMQAAAEVFGAGAVGVLLTGMGRDGAYGMLTIRRSGGHTIAQDEASSAIFGMPRAAIQLGAATEVLSPARIPARLVEVLSERASFGRARQNSV